MNPGFQINLREGTALVYLAQTRDQYCAPVAAQVLVSLQGMPGVDRIVMTTTDGWIVMDCDRSALSECIALIKLGNFIRIPAKET